MLMYNKNMGINLEKQRSGFTIIEIMLFIGISGFLLIGIMLGTGNSIANQRYNDAVEDAVNMLQNAFSFVADTELNERDTSEGCDRLIKGNNHISIKNAELGRGRTSCAVYGAVITIDKTTIQMSTIIGKDYYDVLHSPSHSDVSESDYNIITDPSSSDIDVLKALSANNVILQCDGSGNCKTVPAGSMSKRTLKWSAIFKKPGNKDADLQMTLLIYRSPSSGAIRTLVKDDVIRYNGNPVDYTNADFISNKQPKEIGVYNTFSKPNDFSQKDVFFCVASYGNESYTSHERIIRIMKNAHSQSGIFLENMDDVILDSAGRKISCDN